MIFNLFSLSLFTKPSMYENMSSMGRQRADPEVKREKIMNNFTFALPSGYDWDVKKFAKEVKTKKWANKFSRQLTNCADRLTNANCDNVHVIGGMLQCAYGANIGRQVEELLTVEDFAKIKINILSAVYY